MPAQVQIHEHGKEWVCKIRPRWDALTIWLLVRQILVLTVIGLLVALVLARGNLEMGLLPRMSVPGGPYAGLALLALALLEVSQSYRFIRWMRHGERVTISAAAMAIQQPAIFRPHVTLPLADIGDLTLAEHHRGTTILRPHGAMSHGRIDVWAETGWYSFGRGLSQEQAQKLLSAVRSELRRRGWDEAEDEQEESDDP